MLERGVQTYARRGAERECCIRRAVVLLAPSPSRRTACPCARCVSTLGAKDPSQRCSVTSRTQVQGYQRSRYKPVMLVALTTYSNVPCTRSLYPFPLLSTIFASSLLIRVSRQIKVAIKLLWCGVSNRMYVARRVHCTLPAPPDSAGSVHASTQLSHC